MKNKMTVRLIITIVVTVTLLAAIMAPVYFYLQPKMYINQQIRYVDEFSQKFMAVEPFDKENLDAFVKNSRENYRIYVFDKDFEPMYTSYEFGNNKKFIENLFGKKMESFKPHAEPYYTDVDNDPSIRHSTCCEKNGKVYYIYIKDSLSGVAQVFDFSNMVLGYVVLGYIIICSIVLFLAISPSAKSIREVTLVAKNISDNNLSVRYQGTIHKNEIGELALSVNKMADTIKKNIDNLENYNFVLCEDNRHMMEYEQSRRMLLRNITHDLKTPLAVISSQVEMIATCKEQKDKDYYCESAMEEIGKMSKMISNVLQMTVDERRIISKKAQQFNLSETIAQLCNSSSAYVKSCQLKLDTDITPGIKMYTIKEYLEFVFRNYLSNAVQNAEKNTAIIVSLKETESGVRLSVENQGRHIPDDMKEKIWTESFTTLPKGKDNTGLGLYIVKEISLMERTGCGFENTDNGVRFWFDFIDCSDTITGIEN